MAQTRIDQARAAARRYSSWTSYDCAHGGLTAPVRPDGAGHFDVVGVHVPEHGGPVRIGEVPDTVHHGMVVGSFSLFQTKRLRKMSVRSHVSTPLLCSID